MFLKQKILKFIRRIVGTTGVKDSIVAVKSMLEYNSRIQKVLLFISLYKDKDKIFYLNTPEHENIGDQAIAYGSTKLLQDLYPKYQIIEFTQDDWLLIKEYIMEYITEKDVIFLVGGGNFGDLWINEEEVRRSIVRSFPNNKIISMAQSVTFTDDKEKQISQNIYSQHSNFTIIARDKKSFHTIKELFPQNKLYMSPDSALYLEEYYAEFYKHSLRDGILFLLRSDKEKAISDKKIAEVQVFLEEQSISYTVSDTVVLRYIQARDRKEELEDILSSIAHSKLVITDRYHGLIFSVITGTPCIVFKSLDHKISEGVKWFNHLSWIHYVDEQSDIRPFIDQYINKKSNIDHPYTFKENIFSFYKDIIN